MQEKLEKLIYLFCNQIIFTKCHKCVISVAPPGNAAPSLLFVIKNLVAWFKSQENSFNG